MSPPVIGLVVPPRQGRVPGDAGRLYPRGVRFVAAGLGLRTMTPQDYARALEGLDAAVGSLREEGARAVSLMGTSLSFYRGAQAHEELLARLERATGGLPVTTMARGVVRALRRLGAARVAVGAAYTPDVTDTLVDFLDAHGIAVTGRASMGVTGVAEVGDVASSSVTALAQRALRGGDRPDAVLLSCGGLDTLDTIAALERRWGLPVVSSSQAGLWDVAGLVRPTPRPALPARLLDA